MTAVYILLAECMEVGTVASSVHDSEAEAREAAMTVKALDNADWFRLIRLDPDDHCDVVYIDRRNIMGRTHNG